jgi:hypothetical protein
MKDVCEKKYAPKLQDFKEKKRHFTVNGDNQKSIIKSNIKP